MFPGQHYVPRMPQGSRMANNMLIPPGNLNTGLLDESSRKRKSFDTNQPAPIFVSANEYGRPLGYNLQKGSFSGIHEQNQAYELNSNQSMTTGSTASLHQFDKDQLHYHNSYPRPSVTNNMNFLNGNHNLCNAPLPSAPQSGPFQARSINFTMNNNHSLGNAPLPPPPLPHSGPFMSSKMNYIQNENHNLGNLPLPSHPQPSHGESFGSGNMQAADGVVRSIWQAQACNVAGTRQNNQLLNGGGGNDVSNPKSFPQNELQFGSSGSFGAPSDQISETRRQEIGDGSVKELEKMIESAVKNLNYSLPVVSAMSCSTPKSTETTRKTFPASVSLSSDEKDRSANGKAASTVAEKLWEGSLQLSSTVTVSSVAYFKSGEKLLNNNWYNSVEVKGKVRLEAFEKYIQDLPCSRNKGMMVISLCLKEGSSASEVKSMMEVARGYMKGKRVGFAHLSREIHLYICPRSEPIITILAKYGFYKGMAAIEERQDSMIGCVIWRKSRTSDSVAKKPVTKKKKAPSEPSDRDSDIEDSPLIQLIQEIVAPLSTTFTSTVEGDSENGGKCSESDPIKTQSEVSGSLTATQRDLTMVSDQPVKKLRPEQPEGNFNFPNPIVPSPAIVKEKTSFDDDIDDLPEFDFMATGKPSLSRQLSTGVQEIEQANPLQIPAFTPSEKSTVAFPSRKNLFDDDDMPEWCPPEHHNQSKFPVSHFKNSPHGPPFSPQGFGPVGHFHTPQLRPSQGVQSSENGSHSNLILGAPPGFNSKFSFNRADKQGWGPR